MPMRRIAPLLLLLVATASLGGCYCAQDVWCGTKAAVCEQVDYVRQPCCPDPCGVVYTTPVYSSGCVIDNRVGSGGDGAFKTP